jgi:hypothetical protein
MLKRKFITVPTFKKKKTEISQINDPILNHKLLEK